MATGSSKASAKDGIVGILGGLLLLGPVSLLGSPARSRHVTASLVAEVDSIRPGEAFWVGLRLEMDPRWHTYWKNPGDSGLPTRMTWTLPEGFTAGSPEWPCPQRIRLGPLVDYGYEGEVLLLTRIEPPDHLDPGRSVVIRGRAAWLECREACFPGRADLALTLPVRAGPPQHAAASARLFLEARRRGRSRSGPDRPRGSSPCARPRAAGLRPGRRISSPRSSRWSTMPPPRASWGTAPTGGWRSSPRRTPARPPAGGLKGVVVVERGEGRQVLHIDARRRAPGAALEGIEEEKGR